MCPFAATAKPNIATINALLLHAGGVLRFVMEGERVDGALKDFEFEFDQVTNNAINANEGKGNFVRPPLPSYFCSYYPFSCLLKYAILTLYESFPSLILFYDVDRPAL